MDGDAKTRAILLPISEVATDQQYNEVYAKVESLVMTLLRIERFINAVAPTKISKELDSIRREVRVELGDDA